MIIFKICDEPTVMNIFRLIILFLNIVKVAVPLILIITIMLRFASASTKHDEAQLKKVIQTVPSNAVAAVLIFLVPSLVDMVVKISFPNSEYTKCISGITVEKVNQAYNAKMDRLIATAEETHEYSDYSSAFEYLASIKDQNKKKEYKKRLDNLKEKMNK